ncbi:hypothetical protein GOP47_0024438 [Adiantum capillus-veneris]|uniref:Acid phosphatase n=2 Tax=Adiantum capillus-veneris TaxID=13818 RepID=A0A9D4U2X7_ADICA|nr:hypothetical protein GOP47_0024438 [Adiantum capillus-veneris]
MAGSGMQLALERQPHSCRSWRFNVDVNNLHGWSVVPHKCEDDVEDYMTSSAYHEDVSEALDEALTYARTFMYSADYNASIRYAWIFAVDETSLSNVHYYKNHKYGAEAFNDTLFNKWVELAKAPALEATLDLFDSLKDWGYCLFFLSGRNESQRSATIKNLVKVGYTDYEALILRQTDDIGVNATFYKSSKRKSLEDLGYTIVGNVGDQWSDFTGDSTGNRVFKLPNPMYYTG